MKVYFKIFLFLAVSNFCISCETDPKFSGSPVDSSVEFATIIGTVSTTEAGVVSSQKFPITFTLPQTFNVDVLVEVIAFLPTTNKRTRQSFIVPAGQTTANVFITAPSRDSSILIFNLNLQVYLSSITTAPSVIPKGFAGKQYSLTSNFVNLDYGDTAFTASNPNRCGIFFDWKGPYDSAPVADNNNLNLVLKRLGVTIPVVGTVNPINGSVTSNDRYETINFLNTAPDGEYIIEVWAFKLGITPTNLPYRFTVRFPDDSVKTFTGILNNLAVGTVASSIPRLKVIKSTSGSGLPLFDVTSL